MVTVPETPRFIFRLPPELRSELKRLADRDNRSLSNLILHILRSWVEQEQQREAGR